MWQIQCMMFLSGLTLISNNQEQIIHHHNTLNERQKNIHPTLIGKSLFFMFNSRPLTGSWTKPRLEQRLRQQNLCPRGGSRGIWPPAARRGRNLAGRKRGAINDKLMINS